MDAPSTSYSAPTPNRSRWMRQRRECMVARDWAGAIRAYAQGLMEQLLLGMHYVANLERAAPNTGRSANKSTSKAQNTPRWWWPPLS